MAVNPPTNPEDIEPRLWIQQIESELARRHNWQQQEQHWEAERKHWRILGWAAVLGPTGVLMLVALRMLGFI